MATTLNAATFMGKNFSTIQSVVKNHESLTLKQMFDVTAPMDGIPALDLWDLLIEVFHSSPNQTNKKMLREPRRNLSANP